MKGGLACALPPIPQVESFHPFRGRDSKRVWEETECGTRRVTQWQTEDMGGPWQMIVEYHIFTSRHTVDDTCRWYWYVRAEAGYISSFVFAAPPSSFGNNNEGMTNVVGVSQIGYVTVIVCPPHNQAQVRGRVHNIQNDFQLFDDYVGFWVLTYQLTTCG